MSDRLTNAAALFYNRRGQLSKAMDEMAEFVADTSRNVYISGTGNDPIHHLNTRLFLQVHVTNVIEASQDYDQAVAAYLAERAKQ